MRLGGLGGPDQALNYTLSPVQSFPLSNARIHVNRFAHANPFDGILYLTYNVSHGDVIRQTNLFSDADELAAPTT